MYLFDYHCLHTIMVLSLVIAWWLDLGDEQGPTRDVLPAGAGDAARAPVGRWGQKKRDSTLLRLLVLSKDSLFNEHSLRIIGMKKLFQIAKIYSHLNLLMKNKMLEYLV